VEHVSFTANLVILPSTTGLSESFVLPAHVHAGPNPPSFVETAIYDDTLVKTAQGWKFKKRVVWPMRRHHSLQTEPLPEAKQSREGTMMR